MSVLALLAAEGGFTTPHSWWPEWYEIVFGGASSVLVVGALWKFAVPSLRTYLEARRARIARELEHAGTAYAESIEEAARIRAAIGDLPSERARILAEADQTESRMLAEGRARINTEVGELEARADADIAVTRQRVAGEIQAEVASWAVAAMDLVVTRSLDDARLVALLEEAIASIGASR